MFLKTPCTVSVSSRLLLSCLFWSLSSTLKVFLRFEVFLGSVDNEILKKKKKILSFECLRDCPLGPSQLADLGA